MQYSTDKMATWETYDGSIVELDDCMDNRVYFRADPENPNAYGFHKEDYDHGEAWSHYFKTDKSVKAGGNIQFLLESTGTRTDVPALGFCKLFGFFIGFNSECATLTKAPELPATTLADGCYAEMFLGCKSLTTAPALPATTLTDRCYAGMFYDCTSLSAAPSLPATTLARYCYGRMFSRCTSLTAAPSLPATTLVDYCYSSMFYGCTSLTAAPSLPATTLADYCYCSMFSNCSKLASMDVSFTVWNPTNATTSWVNGAGTQATGEKTFTCLAALPNIIGNSNIPSEWTRVEK